MKKPVPVLRIVALALFGASAVFATATTAPSLFSLPPDRPGCDAPIPYRVDPSDRRFPLDPAEFRRGVFEAETLWETGTGKDLLIYDPVAPLTVRTEFDDRQKMTYEARDLEAEVSRYETESAKLGREYDAALAKHRKAGADFKNKADAYNRKLADYNDDVREWNDSGTGTSEEYESLEKRRKRLEEEERGLVEESEKMNRLTESVNALAGRLNSKTVDINRNIGTFRERYGEPKPFVQGLYDPSDPSVTIFQFEDEDDLRLVLAHEFGHALGIGEHVGNASSVMFHLMGGQDLDRPALSVEDMAAYAAVCPERNLSKREKLVRMLVLTPIADLRTRDIVSILMKE